MDIYLFVIFFTLAAFLLLLSVMRSSRILGAFAGFFFLVVYVSISIDGITIPFGETWISNATTNVTAVVQNVTNIFDRTLPINLGLGIILLGFSVYIIAVNMMNLIEEKRLS